MNYEFYISHPVQKAELKLNLIFDYNLQLINALDRSVNHLLIRKFFYIPNS